VVRNCILWGNKTADGSFSQIVDSSGALVVTYSDVQGGCAGTGNLDADPLFADTANNDYHEKSASGRWTGTQWVTDAVTSPCIDAGDPASAFSNEPIPNGGRVNLGAFGNTVEASKGANLVQFVVTPTAVSVPEGGTATFTVALDAAPDAEVTATVARVSGDADITVQDGAALLFSTTDWATPQTVTLAAAEDDADAVNGTAVVTVSSAAILPVDVAATEIDNDRTLTVTGGTPAGTTVHPQGAVVAIAATPAAHYHFTQWTGTTAGIADVNAVSTTITLTANAVIVAGSAIDQHTVSATTEHGTVTGAGTYDYGSVIQLQVFVEANYHFVTWTGDVPPGHATDNPLSLTVTGNLALTAVVEHDVPQIYVSTTSLSVPEGGVAGFSVNLTLAPAADVTVSAAVLAGGDPDLSIESGSSLLFTTADWATPQAVTIAAAEDVDTTAGSATVRLTATGMNDVDVAVTEADNDVTLTVTAGAHGSVTPSGASVRTRGAVVAIQATPDADYKFTAWTGDTANIAAPDAASTTITMTAAASITAAFAPLAPTWYVNASTGSDSYDGLAAVSDGTHGPKATIQAAINVSASDDTVIVAQGTYYEQINFNGKDITVRSTDPTSAAVVAATVLNGGGSWESPATVVSFLGAETNAAVLTGFTITCSQGQGIACRNGSSPTISRNVIYGNVGESGGGITSAGSSPVIETNTIRNNSGKFTGGVYLYGGAPVLRGNLIRNNGGKGMGGVYCYNCSPLIANNVIVKNSAWMMGGGGIALSGSSPEITTNTIADNTGGDPGFGSAAGGILCYSGSPVVRNCILWGNKTADGSFSQIVDSSGALVVTYSDVQGGCAGTGNLDADPLFVDPASNDFHEKSMAGRWTGSQWVTDTVDSPCLDTGDPLSAFSNEPLPNGGRVNMGAYGNTAEASKGMSVVQFVLSATSVSVPEGSSSEFTVALTAGPDADVSATVAFLSGDTDISVQGGVSLLFTTTDWAVPKTVTLAAAEDDADADNGTATIRVSAPAVSAVQLAATEVDNDVRLTVTGGTPSGITIHPRGAVVTIVATPVEHYHFTEWTGDTAGIADVHAATTTIALTANASIAAASAIDRHTVTANAVNGSVNGAGAFDYGSSIQLDAIPAPDYHFVNWTGDVPAGHDTDNPLLLTVSGDLALTANFAENPPVFVVSTASIAVPEGEVSTFTVALSKAPLAGDLAAGVAVAAGGDPDIAVQSGSALLFTAANWDVAQTVTVAAAEDDTDTANGAAVVRVSAPGLADADIAATEVDDDVALTVTGGTPAGITIHERGSVVTITATPAPHDHFTQWTGDTAEIADVQSATTTITLTAAASIAAGSAIDRHTVTVNAVNGTVTGAGTYDYGSVVQVRATANVGYHFSSWAGDVPPGQANANPLSVTVNGDLTLTANCEVNRPELQISVTTVAVPEGGTGSFTVSLTMAPAADVTVTVAVVPSGDPDIRVQAGASLHFTPANWAAAQTVTLAAIEDDSDTTDGQAAVRVSAPEMSAIDVTATEDDNDTRRPPVAGRTEATDRAIAYLESRQNDDGSWGASEKQIVETVEAFKALLPFERTEALNAALAFIGPAAATDNDRTARKLSVLIWSTADTGELVRELTAAQRDDGGWGLNEKKQSDVRDTILAVDALLSAEHRDSTTLAPARDYLVEAQEASGAWVFAEEDSPSAVIRTAMGLSVLKQIEEAGAGSSALRGAASKAQAFVESRETSGAFGSILDTAYCYLALARVKQPAELQDSLALLLNAQEANGSWADDVYTTAVVLQVLHAVSPPEAGPMPDLLVETSAIAFSPASPESGDIVSLTVTVFNQGPADAEQVTVEVFNGDPRMDGAAIGTPSTVACVPAGSSAAVSVALDTTGLVGEQFIVVAADRANAIAELSETNNWAWQAMPLGGTPDLALTAADLSAGTPSPATPDQVEITARVRNNGTAPAEGVVLRFAEGSTVLGEVTVPALDPTSTGILTLVATLAPGAHTVTVTADPAGSIAELDETNNQASIVLNVQPEDRPDLTVSPAGISFSGTSPLPGTIVQVTATVRNDGALPSGDFKVLFTDGDPFAGGAFLIGEANVASIAAAGAIPVTVAFTVPRGGHDVFVFVDSEQMLQEASEGNNVASASLTTAPVPDLAVAPEFIVVSHTNLDVNRNVGVTAVVSNLGQTDAGEVTVQLVSLDGAGGLLLGEQTVGPLAVGESAQVSFVFCPEAGPWNLQVRVDPENGVTELDEANNAAVKSVTFIYSELTVRLLKRLDGDTIPATAFSTYEIVEIQVLNPIQGDGVFTFATVSNEYGETFNVAPKYTDPNLTGTVPDVFEFPTLNHRAGNYVVNAEVRQRPTPYTYRTLSTCAAPFTIEPSHLVRAVTPYPEQATFLKGPRTLPLYVQISSGANVDADLTLSYVVTGPDGQTIAQGAVDRAVPWGKALDTVQLPGLEYNFQASGRYVIAVDAFADSGLLAAGQGSFQVEGPIHLRLTKTVSPMSLPPLQDGRAQVILNVERIDHE